MSAPGVGRGFNQSAPPVPQVFTGLVVFASIATLAPPNNFMYYPGMPTLNSSPSRHVWRAPTAGVIRRPRFWNQTPTGADPRTYTAHLNNVATAWVLAVTSGTATLETAGVGDIAVVAGDEVDVRSTGGNAAQVRPTYTFEFWGLAP